MTTTETQLASFIISQLDQDADATDAEIAHAYNNSPARYAPLRLSFLELGKALARSMTPVEAVAIGDRLIKDVESTKADKPALAAIFRGYASSDRREDFADPFVRSQLASLPQSPGPFTAADLAAVADLLTDLHGGDVTEAGVAAERSRIALRERVNNAAAATIAAIDADQTPGNARAKAAFDEAWGVSGVSGVRGG